MKGQIIGMHDKIASHKPDGANPFSAFSDRQDKEFFIRSSFERLIKRFSIEIRQQRKLEFAKLSKRDRLDIDTRVELYHMGDRIPVGCVPGDQKVGEVQRDIAFRPDRQSVFGRSVRREI